MCEQAQGRRGRCRRSAVGYHRGVARLRRFLCPRCGATLTPWLRALSLAEAQASFESRTWLVPGGWFLHCDELRAGAWDGGLRAYPWLIAPLPPRWLRPHPDPLRSGGCCGMGFDEERPNLVCACGHEVGIGYRDCCNPQWYALREQVGQAELDDPAPPQGVAHGLARARAIVDGTPVAAAPCTVGRGVDLDDPSSWSAAPRLHELRLSCSGGEADPVLAIESPELPAGAALVVPVPWVVLVRMIALGERPWGAPEVPLPWQSMRAAAPIVHLSGRRKVVLMTVWGPGAQASAVRFTAAAWAGAWARLRASA
jgi:hypothetical protein